MSSIRYCTSNCTLMVGFRCSAEEYKQRVAAGDWAEAHALFAEELGPCWWLSGQQAKLRSRLQPLLQAAQEARVHVDALQWATGTELYATFFDLEVPNPLPQYMKLSVRTSCGL